MKPGSSRSELRPEADGSFVAWLHSPPVDGRANAELVELVAGYFGCPKSRVRIRGGAGGRRKRIDVQTCQPRGAG